MYTYWVGVNYREAYELFACNGILFNHESPRRGEIFIMRKITRGLAKIHLVMELCLYLVNLTAKREWGHAKGYVKVQWLMLQQDTAEDFCSRPSWNAWVGHCENCYVNKTMATY